jgi:hypothetical protein
MDWQDGKIDFLISQKKIYDTGRDIIAEFG